MRRSLLVVTALAISISAAMIQQAAAEDVGHAQDLTQFTAVGNDALGRANGKEGLSFNNSEISNTSALNQANGASSGNASIGEGALSNVNGIAAVVVNSGQNAVVQVSQQVIFNLH